MQVPGEAGHGRCGHPHHQPDGRGLGYKSATLVSDWQGRDILAPMLARRKVELDIMMVSCLTHPDLVRRMAEEGVKGVSRDVDQLMLYRLVNVPRILNLFMVTKDRQRMAAVTSAVQQFDPVSQFWVGELVVTADLVLFILRSILTVRFGY